MAWPGDWPDFQTRAGPVGTSRDGDEAQEDDDMGDVMDFFLGGGGVIRLGSPNL